MEGRSCITLGGKPVSQSEIERLSALIGDVYDAALDPALWPSVLAKLCAFVPGRASNIFSQDAIKKTANRYFMWGIDPYYDSLYLEKYAALNPLFPSVLFFPVGEVYEQTDIMPVAELRQSRLYKEWMQPQGYIDFIGSTIDKSASSAAFLVLIRHERDGWVDGQTRRRVRLIAPHVRRAILIAKVIDLKTVEANALASALDGLAAGMVLVDANARIVHANASALDLIAEGVVIQSVGGRLGTYDPLTNLALREILAQASAGDAALGLKGIAVPLAARNGPDHVAHILPLTSAGRSVAGRTHSAVAAVFVQKAAPDLQSLPEAVARRYDLTAGQLRVLFTLINVGSVAEVSRVLGISEGTVRNHLHHLFEKTSTRRQADLIKLIGGFANPLIK
jgi:DNA-binding CsgD family transcriptional regulator/PAS domain-containing protein